MMMTAEPRGDSCFSGFISSTTMPFRRVSSSWSDGRRRRRSRVSETSRETGCQKCTGSNGRKFGLYHQTVKRAAIRILMGHFPGLLPGRFIGTTTITSRTIIIGTTTLLKGYKKKKATTTNRNHPLVTDDNGEGPSSRQSFIHSKERRFRPSSAYTHPTPKNRPSSTF